MHEEDHLHLPRILRALETLRRDLDDAAAEEGQSHDLRVLERGARDFAGKDG